MFQGRFVGIVVPCMSCECRFWNGLPSMWVLSCTPTSVLCVGVQHAFFRGACALQQWSCLCTSVRLSGFSRVARHWLLRQRMSQVALALDVASAKRRRLVGKSRICDVVLPTGALPVAADGRGVADAQAGASAVTAVLAAGRGMHKKFLRPSSTGCGNVSRVAGGLARGLQLVLTLSAPRPWSNGRVYWRNGWRSHPRAWS